MLVELKPLEWFEENAYKDHDGDFWKTNNARNYYDNFHEIPELYYSVYAHNIIKGYVDMVPEFLKIQSWAIEKLLPKDEYPEYYIIQ